MGTTGTCTTYTGADGQSGNSISLNKPTGLWIDTAGNLYVVEQSAHVVRKMDTAGIVNSFAGKPGNSGSDGDSGPATSAKLTTPSSIFGYSDEKLLFISDTGNARIRRVYYTGSAFVITNIAGINTGGEMGTNVLALSGQVYDPRQIWGDANQNIYFNQHNNGKIRKLVPQDTNVVPVYKIYVQFDSGRLTIGLCLDKHGNFYFGSDAFTISFVDKEGSSSTVVAGIPWQNDFAGDFGPATSAKLQLSQFLYCDHTFGDVYIGAGGSKRVRKLYELSQVYNIAGSGSNVHSGDGSPALAASVNKPRDVWVDSAGNVYIADTNNNRIRKVNAADSIISTFACSASSGLLGEGVAATTAACDHPSSIQGDTLGNIYFADRDNDCIRKVATNNIITLYAGSGCTYASGGTGGCASCSSASSCNDNGHRTASSINRPVSIFCSGVLLQ